MGFFGSLIYGQEAKQIAIEYENKISRTAKEIKNFIEKSNDSYTFEDVKEKWGFDLDLKSQSGNLPEYNLITIFSVLTSLSLKIISEKSSKSTNSLSFLETVTSSLFNEISSALNLNYQSFSHLTSEKIIPDFLENLSTVARSSGLHFNSMEPENYDEFKAAAHTITERLFIGNIHMNRYKYDMQQEENGTNERIYGFKSDFNSRRYEKFYEETCKRITKIISKNF